MTNNNHLIEAIDRLIETYTMVDSLEGVASFKEDLHKLILADRERMIKAFKERTSGDTSDYVEMVLFEVIDIVNGEKQ